MILIDSAGVDTLARVSAWTRDNGGDLVLRSASPDLAEQLELARRRSPPAASLNWELTATAAGPRRIVSSQVSSSKSGMRCPPLQLSRWADWIPFRSQHE
jgi:hypothetical protein